MKAAFELKAEGIIIANMNSARPSDLLSIPLGPHDKPSAEMVPHPTRPTRELIRLKLHSSLFSIAVGSVDLCRAARQNRMFSVLMVSKQFGVDLAALDGGVSFVGTIQGERHMGFSYK